jgi:hypothetical protein
MGSFSVAAGSLSLSYINQQFTTFDGSTIVMDSGVDDGQGIVTVSSTSPFTSLSFVHAQNPQNVGFVIERVTTSAVPEPGTALLLGGGLASVALATRRSRER